MNDTKLNISQRNTACYQLRGVSAPEVISEMRRALADPVIRSCAGENLRRAGAVEELKSALGDEDFEVRALAARELGSFARPDLLPLLRDAARDRQLVVAMNAIEGLANYRETIVVPYLLEIAADGGLVGEAALQAAMPFHDPRTVTAARALLKKSDVSDKLAAMRVLAQAGDESDVAALREIAERETALVSQQRGFGLMPAISLSRAAQTTIAKIEERTQRITSKSLP